MRLRRIALSGDFDDTDWTDPANLPPDSARRFSIVSENIQFEIIGLAGTEPEALQVAVAGLTVDGWVGYEGPSLPRAGSPASAPTIRRGESIVEAAGMGLSAVIRFEASGAQRGGVGRLNLSLTNPGALAAVEVRIVSGARVL